MRARTAVALTGACLAIMLLLASWLFSRDGLTGRETNELGESARRAAPMPWVQGYVAPEVTANEVTLAAQEIGFSGKERIFVGFWLLVRDPALQDFQVRPLGVALRTTETRYPFSGGGTLLMGGGVHLGSAAFSGYDYANSHPYIPGRNKELSLSIKALEVLNPDGSVQKIIEGPWETVVAVRSDLAGGGGGGYGLVIGVFSQSQMGTTVRLSNDRVGSVIAYDVIQEGKPTRFLPLGYNNNVPYVMSAEEYERIVKDTMERAAKGPYYDWIPQTPTSQESDAPSAPVGLGVQAGNAIVEVDSASVPQGQQAQVAVTVKGINDPDGLGAYSFVITFNPAVVNVVSVGGGQAPFSGTPTQNINNTTGQVLFNAIQGAIPGPTGDIIVAYVMLQAVGSPGASTVLNISITTLAETAVGDPIPAVDQDGTVTIVP